jgi:hypothetical protein
MTEAKGPFNAAYDERFKDLLQNYINVENQLAIVSEEATRYCLGEQEFLLSALQTAREGMLGFLHRLPLYKRPLNEEGPLHPYVYVRGLMLAADRWEFFRQCAAHANEREHTVDVCPVCQGTVTL